MRRLSHVFLSFLDLENISGLSLRITPFDKFSHFENDHAMGHVEHIVQTVRVTLEGPYLDVLEKFHIYRETKRSNETTNMQMAPV